ncbi:MAG TPA: M64 family metallopeptidase [Ignavibacteriaceae bacterium]|nr:M64 family metallopeptidase [Ignavibacteriaceae bacterium]
MKKYLYLITLFFIPFSYAQVNFDDYFLNKSLRIDYHHFGNSENDFYAIDELIEEPFYGGSKKNLLDVFNYGDYIVKVFGKETNELIFSKTFTTLFNEWQTVDEAKKTTKGFSEAVVIPYPKKSVKVEFYSRDKKNNPVKKFEYEIDPSNYFIKKDNRHKYSTFDVLKNGDPSVKVDIVILPEGYTKDEMELFKKDCEEFSQQLFNSSPYKENKNKFNIYGVEAPSEESGTDIPATGVWKKTLLNSNFYTFDLDRYLMTSDYKTVCDVAANAPYDQIFILVNSDKYGGGAIYNHYSVCINKNKYKEYITVHEFGHGFAGLADEYYTSDVAYENFYPLDVEPLEANLTTLVNFDSKWKNMIDEDIPVPTPNEEKYKNILGAFEGGGYVAKGVYRPRVDCTMHSISVDNFCPVCYKALEDMINFYSE